MVNGKNGVFDLKPITMQVFGAQGTGNIHADFSNSVAHYSVNYSLPQFQIAELFKALSPQTVAEGHMDFSANLLLQGRTVDEMKRTLEGQLSLQGKELTLTGSDLDKEIASFESSQHFNLVDVGAVFFAGPLGLVVTKGYNFAASCKHREALARSARSFPIGRSSVAWLKRRTWPWQQTRTGSPSREDSISLTINLMTSQLR